MKVKIPKRENASRILSIRLPESEYDALKAAAMNAKTDIAPLARAILMQAIKSGLEVES